MVELTDNTLLELAAKHIGKVPDSELIPDLCKHWPMSTGDADESDLIAFARAAIAADRARRPTPQSPADGEVGERSRISIDEMCEILRSRDIKADEYTDCTILYKVTFDQLRAICDTRTADLLERLASPACLVINPSPEDAAAFGAAHIAHGRIERLPANMQLIEPAERTVLVPVAQPVAVSERLPGAGDCDELDNCWQWEPDSNGHHPLGEWKLLHRDWLSDPDGDATHWLPFNALPLPQGNDT